jgi:hypothetical protein
MSLSAVKLNDRINPIVVKEMRQAVKGKFTSWTLMLILVIQLAIIGSVLVLSKDIGKNFSIGQGLFTGLLGLLLLICLFLVPIFTGSRLSQEKASNNVDLFFITTLKPSQIIWGKLFAALVVTLLFFTASLPFMTLTYLFRGLDLPTIFIVLAFDFLAVAACIQFCILLACLPGGIVSRIIRLLGVIIALFIVFEIITASSYQMLYSGIGSTITTWHFWSRALTVESLVLIGIGLLFSLSVALISPVSANRLCGVRTYMLFTWLSCGIISSIWFFTTGNRFYIQPWLMFMVIMFGISMLASVCEHQTLSPRVVKDIPKNRILRIPAFLLFSGPAGGVVFSLIMLIITLLIYPLMLKIGLLFNRDTLNINDYREFYLIAIGLALYICCYSLTSLDIKIIFFKKSISTQTIIIGIISFLLIGSILPIIIGFLIRQNLWQELNPLWYIGNPLVLFLEKKIWVECFTFTSVWVIIALAISLPWIFRQIRGFKPA